MWIHLSNIISPLSHSLRRTRSCCAESVLLWHIKGEKGRNCHKEKSRRGKWNEWISMEGGGDDWASLYVWTVPSTHRPDVPCSKGTMRDSVTADDSWTHRALWTACTELPPQTTCPPPAPSCSTDTNNTLHKMLVVESFCPCVWFVDVLKQIWAAGGMLMALPMITCSQRGFDLVLSHFKSLFLFLFSLSGSEVCGLLREVWNRWGKHRVWWEGDRCMQVDYKQPEVRCSLAAYQHRLSNMKTLKDSGWFTGYNMLIICELVVSAELVFKFSLSMKVIQWTVQTGAADRSFRTLWTELIWQNISQKFCSLTAVSTRLSVLFRTGLSIRAVTDSSVSLLTDWVSPVYLVCEMVWFSLTWMWTIMLSNQTPWRWEQESWKLEKRNDVTAGSSVNLVVHRALSNAATVDLCQKDK